MAIKEQKLFFTRNGEYSLWEKLIHLENEQLELLLDFCFSKFNPTGAPGVIDEYPSWLYKQYNICVDQANKLLYTQKIDDFFNQNIDPMNDFNALLYYIPGELFDKASVLRNLRNLNILDFDIENLKIESFDRSEKNQVDIRFRSPRISRYKESEFEQLLNTEIRLYLDLRIVLITNWSNYTHSESTKTQFINESIKLVSTVRTEVKPFKFSDNLMRKLLHTGKQQTSKLKFALEDRLRVAIEINQSSSIEEAIKHDEIKYFFNKGSLALLKVELDNDPTKTLIIDADGKLMSRTQNLHYNDIDEFIEQLHPLLKYDYLNDDYKSLFKQLAYTNLQGINSQKDIVINKCLLSLNNIFQKNCNDPSNVFSSLIMNMFLYCIIHQIYLFDTNEVNIEIPETTLRYVAQIRSINKEKVSQIINSLFKHYYLLNNDLELLIVKYDEIIDEYQRMITDATGA